MTRSWIGLLVFVLVLLFVLIYSINIYFLKRLYSEIDIADRISANLNQNTDFATKQRLNRLKPIYRNKNPRLEVSANAILKSLQPTSVDNVSAIFSAANRWPTDNVIYPLDPAVGKLIKVIQDAEIRKAQNSPRGTQLKLVFQLPHSQLVLFKPRWYPRNKVVTGPVYSGKDRHTSEIVTFYLGAMLNLRWTPIAVGRKINLKEVYMKGNLELQSTMLIKNNGSQYCVFGKCFYCKVSEIVCGDENDMVEGVILYLIPGSISKHRSPWQRTYKDNVKATWEQDENYCDSLKTTLSRMRLLDLIDVSIVDFLIQNGDRHHYETRNNRLLLLDNGKGFGNANYDFTDILAPLYQCCIIRKSTWLQLLLYSGGGLTETLKKLTKNDMLYPLLLEEHFDAMERRLLTVYMAVELCKERFGNDVFK